MRIVVDANVLVSGAFWSGLPSRVLSLWAHDRVDVLVSESILAEYERVLEEIGRKAKSPELALQWVQFVGQHGTLIDVRSPVCYCRDPNDDKYLACAADGDADYIVSGDRDLLDLKQFIGIPIVTPRRFLEIGA